jgi:hypothetical protein
VTGIVDAAAFTFRSPRRPPFIITSQENFPQPWAATPAVNGDAEEFRRQNLFPTQKE